MTDSLPISPRPIFCRAAYSVFALLCAAALVLAARSEDGIFSIGIVGAFWIPAIILIPLSAVLAVVSLARREPAIVPTVSLLIFCVALIAYGAHPTYRLLTEPMRFYQ